MAHFLWMETTVI